MYAGIGVNEVHVFTIPNENWRKVYPNKALEPVFRMEVLLKKKLRKKCSFQLRICLVNMNKVPGFGYIY